jgi:hypothetical protein
MPKHRNPALLIALCAILWLSIPLAGQEADWTFDFAGAPDARLIITGAESRVADERLILTGSEAAFIRFDGFPADRTDYTLEVLYTIDTGRVWLQARTDATACRGYYLAVEPQADMADLSRADDACQFDVLAVRRGLQLPAGEVIRARLTVAGDTIRGSVNDAPELEATDATYPDGQPYLNLLPVDGELHVEILRIAIVPAGQSTEDAATPTPVPTDTPAPTATEIVPSETPAPTATEPTASDTPVPTASEIAASETPIPTETESPVTDSPPAAALAFPAELPFAVDRSPRPAEVMAFLSAAGLVADNGTLETANGITIARIGDWFSTLTDLTASDAVMGGRVRHISVGSDGERCALSLRMGVDAGGRLVDFLDLGIASREDVFALEVTGREIGNSVYEMEQVASDQPHNLLAIVIADRAWLYIDSELVVDGLEVTDRGGLFGVSAASDSSATICDFRDLWLFALPD